MNHQYAKLLENKLCEYKKLCARRDELYKVLSELEEFGKDDIHNQNPFTGNTRESRKVQWLSIGFSATLGGGKPIDVCYNGNFNISACDLSRFLHVNLNNQIKEINKLIEELV